MPSRPTERLFFALRPDAATAQRIDALARSLTGPLQLKGRPLGPARYHVTLHLLGDYAEGIPAGVLDAALAAAEPVASDTAVFAVAFDRVESFDRKARNMPLVLLGDADLHALAALQQRLLCALVDAGLAAAKPARYTPHLTLLYDDARVEPRPVEPIGWVAKELLLVRSLLGLSRHEVLARLALRGALPLPT